ncbi:MAG: ferredoxin [Candidatus Nanohaloarchaeota archaeon QJJ-7]|nr:ferredoxin [Candidatus Nanohaloarchaeota archaeon QJJ-7]
MEFADNVEVSEEGYAEVGINPEIFSLEVIYSAAYTFLDRAYFVFDGDPDEEIKVRLKPKGEEDAEELALEMQNELINYAVYVIQASRNQEVRNAIIKKALATNGVDASKVMGEKNATKTNSTDREAIESGQDAPIGPSESEEYIDDPEGIADTWSPDKAEGLSPPGENDDEEEGDDTVEEGRDVLDEDPEGIAETWSQDKAPGSIDTDEDVKEVDEVEEDEEDDYTKVEIERENCIGCGVCTNIAPEVFELENGRSKVQKQVVNEKVEEAMEACPVESIQVVED